MIPRAADWQIEQKETGGKRIFADGGFMAENKMNKFEDNIAELERLVKRLESDVALDEAIAAFEKGIALTKIGRASCRERV